MSLQFEDDETPLRTPKAAEKEMDHSTWYKDVPQAKAPKKPHIDISTEITLLESFERRVSMLKMNGKTGLLYELHIIIDQLRQKGGSP